MISAEKMEMLSGVLVEVFHLSLGANMPMAVFSFCFEASVYMFRCAL